MADAKTDKPKRLRNFRRKMHERRALRVKWKQQRADEAKAAG
jgi:hypothetical protein